MLDKHDVLYKDLEAVKQIHILPAMLDIICRLTGLGYAAVARVTDDRWLACSVRDEVNFGLVEGAELKLETTICNEIRQHHNEVVIDHVANDPDYKEHHTPKLYGLQSYISFPILLKNGDFFGTLCAIGTKPATLKDPKITGTFKLFAELISFHLQSIDLMEQSHVALRETKGTLLYTTHENLLYQQISDHNLQEPLRKISVYSDLLINHTENADVEKAKKTAKQISSFAIELNDTIQNITKFTNLKTWDASFEPVDLNAIIENVKSELKSELDEKNISIEAGKLPVLFASEKQMKLVFSQLIGHGITFSKISAESVISISAEKIERGQIKYFLPSEKASGFSVITMVFKDIETDNYDTSRIFDILIHREGNVAGEKYGNGLADCRKIIFNHGGMITAKATADSELTFSIVLPENELVEELAR